jgi:hypothetical protein
MKESTKASMVTLLKVVETIENGVQFKDQSGRSSMPLANLCNSINHLRPAPISFVDLVFLNALWLEDLSFLQKISREILP